MYYVGVFDLIVVCLLCWLLVVDLLVFLLISVILMLSFVVGYLRWRVAGWLAVLIVLIS